MFWVSSSSKCEATESQGRWVLRRETFLEGQARGGSLVNGFAAKKVPLNMPGRPTSPRSQGPGLN